MRKNIDELAIDSTLKYHNAYCKMLSPNDAGETDSHQSGILVSKNASELLFTKDEIQNNSIFKRSIEILWQNNFKTESCFTWYRSKNELRITKFGRNFEFRGSMYTGSLFVLVKQNRENYLAYVMNTEAEINNYLDCFGMTPAETNRLVNVNGIRPDKTETNIIKKYITVFDGKFPSTEDMASTAHKIYKEVYGNNQLITEKPDQILLDWTQEEFKLFSALEYYQYGTQIEHGFSSMDSFLEAAKSILNRRKSRAGKSLEHHLEAIFTGNRLKYTAQGVTELRKTPDFIFPSIEDYHNLSFPENKLCSLAAKTTCKDRWRQVITEADRLKDDNKYLCTLQQGISSEQMAEMESEKVVLVIPETYIKTYPSAWRSKIWSLSNFIDYVKELEGIQ